MFGKKKMCEGAMEEWKWKKCNAKYEAEKKGKSLVLSALASF